MGIEILFGTCWNDCYDGCLLLYEQALCFNLLLLLFYSPLTSQSVYLLFTASKAPNGGMRSLCLGSSNIPLLL